MSGLLALLDDVAGIAKVAAASVDDVAAAAGKAGAKTAGVIIDDAAVTPKYVQGFAPARELPIIWRIARGSMFNKVILLLPVALLLANFAPWLITPLLMIGGSYLCFEGAEKIFHVLFPHGSHVIEEDMNVRDPGHLEEQKIKGAIKTDFILSAEIMTIALSVVESDQWISKALILAIVAIGITSLVYGAVALLVKMDDIGLKLTQIGRLSATRAFGRGMVRAMPGLLKAIAVIGTAAMLWVGGNIIVHGLDVLGWPWPYDTIHHIAIRAAEAIGVAKGFVEWFVTAALDGVIGLALGLCLIPIVTRAIVPTFSKLFPEKNAGASSH